MKKPSKESVKTFFKNNKWKLIGGALTSAAAICSCAYLKKNYKQIRLQNDNLVEATGYSVGGNPKQRDHVVIGLGRDFHTKHWGVVVERPVVCKKLDKKEAEDLVATINYYIGNGEKPQN